MTIRNGDIPGRPTFVIPVEASPSPAGCSRRPGGATAPGTTTRKEGMTTKNELIEEMTERAALMVELDRYSPEEGGGTGDEIAVAVMITDPRGKALAVEVGTSDQGAFASVRAFDGDTETEPMVFVETTSTMIVVE